MLCCVDGSEITPTVVGVARRLADAVGADVVLVHVEPSIHAPGISAAPAGARRLREEELRDAEALLERVVQESGLDPSTRTRAEIGSAGSRIVELCAGEHAELVVLGSRGRGGLKAALLGSVSSEVASKSPCPCVIVSNAAHERLSRPASA